MKSYHLIAILVISLMTGCASQGSFMLTALDITNSIVFKKNDVTLFINPILDKRKLDEYYGDDLVKKGILPIHIRILNESNNDIGVNIDNFKLNSSKGKSYDSIDVNMIYDQIKNGNSYLLVDIPLILITGVPIAYIFKESENVKTRTNLMINLFKNGIIHRRESVEGMVYMHLTESIENLNNWTFSSTVFLRNSEENSRITVPL